MKKAKQAYKNDPEAKWVLFIKGDDGEYVATTFKSDEELNAYIDENKIPPHGLYVSEKGRGVTPYDPTPVKMALDDIKPFDPTSVSQIDNDKLTTTLAIYSHFNKETVGEVKPYALSYMIDGKTVTVGFESLEEAKEFIEKNQGKIQGTVSFGVRTPGEKVPYKAKIDVTSADSLSELKDKVAGMSEQKEAKASGLAATNGVDEKTVAALDKLWREQNPGKEPEVITGKLEPAESGDKNTGVIEPKGLKRAGASEVDQEVLTAARSARHSAVTLAAAGEKTLILPARPKGSEITLS